ncbi:unnamed protein product [Cunninghamella blakesleeana]
MLKVLPSDELLSYQLLFIKDVKTAKLYSRDPVIYKTQHKQLFQKVRLCGVIVSKQNTDHIAEIDDSTDTIPVHISARLFKRKDSEKIRSAVPITIIGEPKLENDRMIIICDGYQIERCIMAEVEHWLRVMKNNKDKKWIKQEQHKKINPLEIEENEDHNDPKRQKIKVEIKMEEEHPHNIFNSLSSQPSPIRGPIQDLIFSSSPQPSTSVTSPLKHQLNNNNNNNNLMNDNLDLNNMDSSYWHWSPDHIVATSTPVKSLFKPSSMNNNNSPLAYRSSPLNNIITNNTKTTTSTNYEGDFIDEDEFGFDDGDDSTFGRLDFGDLERKAFEQIKKE